MEDKTYKVFVAKQVLAYMYDGSLGKSVQNNFEDVILHLQKLKTDIERGIKIEDNLTRLKPNQRLIEELEEMFYPIEKINAISWDSKTVDSIEYCISELVNAKETLEKYGLNLKEIGE